MKNFSGNVLALLFAVVFAVGCRRETGVAQYFSGENSALAQATFWADSLAENGQLDASDSLLASVAGLAEKTGRGRPAYLFHRRRVLNFFEKKPDAATAEARQLAARFAAPEDSISGFYCSLLGWAEWQTGGYRAAIPVLERAAALFEKHGPSAKLNGIYNNLGICYGQLGDHEKAILNYGAALRINLQKHDSAEVSANYFNISKAWINLQNLQKATENAQLAHDFLQKEDGSFEFQMAEIALARLRPDDALRLVGRLATDRPDLFDPEKNDAAADNLLAFGEVAAAAGQPDRALPFLKKSLPLLSENGNPASWEIVKNCFLVGDCFLKKGQPEAALDWFWQAISAASGKSAPPFHIDSLPPEAWLMEALNGKAQAFTALFELKKRPIDLNAALAAWDEAIGQLQKLNAHFVEDGSRLALGDQTFRAFFEKPVETALRLAELTGDPNARERAFQFSARSKAAVLKTALLEKKQLLAANLPADQMRRFYDLRMAVAALERQVALAPTDSLRAVHFRAKRDFDQFKNSLNLPPVAAENAGAVRLKDLQAGLPEDAILVEYLLGEHFLYVFTVSKNRLDVEKKPLTPKFFAEAEVFRRAVSDWKWSSDSALLAEKSYLRSASWLHGFLLKNSLDRNPGTSRLFVVPDGQLARLPFAALLTEPFSGGWKETGLPVLVKKMAVSYLFSASFLLEKKNPAGNDGRIGFGGFGSDYRDRWTLAALKKPAGQPDREFLLAMRGGPDTLDFADDEVDSIAQLTGGKKWVNERATKANFLENAGRCAILHTSLHTLDAPAHDPSGLSILFSKSSEQDPNLLTSSELYALDLRADLTVVSTCQSGFGEIRRGEGALSLGRAIALAGCPATVVNLWNADDRASKELMIAFYKNLKNGQPKDVALQNAMLFYLKTTVSEKAPPLFWANFSAFGAMEPVVFPPGGTSGRWWAIGLAGLCAICAFVLFFQKKRRGRG